MTMIRVLIVEDSPLMRVLLKTLLASDPEIEVVGTAANGAEAVRQAIALKPDLITMDIRMPVMDGLEATRRIMQQAPTRIVVVSSSVNAPDLEITFNALKAGALDVIEKPHNMDLVSGEQIRDRLVSSIKLMSQVQVIRRRPLRHVSLARPNLSGKLKQPHAVIAIGASTGGPAALRILLQPLPPDLSLPIVIVQHMAIGFTEGLVRWLRSETALPIHLAAPYQRLLPGQIYFAPDDQHLVFTSRDVLGLVQDPPVSHVRPSATVLFNSVARVYGAEAIGVLLTGMGEDGAEGLAAMHQSGALTLAQDEATCIVYGMPRAAVERGAVDQVLPIEQIAPRLIELARR